MLRPRFVLFLSVLAALAVAALIRSDPRGVRTVAALARVAPDGSYRIAGVVLGDGVPLAGARVQLRGPLAGHRFLEREARSDAAGRFDLGEVPLTEYQIVATAPGMTYASDEVETRYVVDKDARPAHQLRLNLASCDHPTIGTVADPEGQPIAGAEIGPDLIPLVTTGADGMFSLCMSKEASWVQVRASGRASMTAMLAPSATLSVTLPVEAAIEGRMVHAGSGLPVAHEQVSVLVRQDSHTWNVSRQTTATDVDGRFRVDELAAGRAFVIPSDPGLRIKLGDHVTTAAGETVRDLVIELVPLS